MTKNKSIFSYGLENYLTITGWALFRWFLLIFNEYMYALDKNIYNLCVQGHRLVIESQFRTMCT